MTSDEGSPVAPATATAPPPDDQHGSIEPVRSFLRALLVAARDPRRGTVLRDTNDPLDEETLRHLIERERVGPLLHRAVAARELLPPATRTLLAESHRATAMRNLLLLHELGVCLARLSDARVPAIVLKGAALAQPVYGSLALRPMVDLDILIHRRDLARARAIIEKLGFRPMRLETHPGALVEHENELAFAKPGAVTVELDVHWRLIDSPFYQRELATEWFWSSARVQRLSRDLSAPTLGADAQLLHLCAHLMLHHRGTRLLWWSDIAELIHVQGRALDWTEVIDRSRRYRLLLPMRIVLAGLAEEWSVPIPADVLPRLADFRPSREEADLFRSHSGPASAGQRFWSDLHHMGSWRQGLTFARTNLVPSRAYMRGRYDIRRPWLVPLYYPYRWLRGLRGAGRRGAHRE